MGALELVRVLPAADAAPIPGPYVLAVENRCAFLRLRVRSLFAAFHWSPARLTASAWRRAVPESSAAPTNTVGWNGLSVGSGPRSEAVVCGVSSVSISNGSWPLAALTRG